MYDDNDAFIVLFIVTGILMSAVLTRIITVFLSFMKSDILINDSNTIISSEFSDDKSEVSIQNIDNTENII